MRYGRLVKETLAGHPVELVDLAGINEEELLFRDADVPAVVEKFRAADVDALFFPHCNFGSENCVAQVAREFRLPVLLWGPRDDAPDAEGLRSRDSQCGLFATGKVLRRLNVPFTYLTNSWADSREFHTGIDKFLRVASVVKAVTRLKILQISTRPAPFCSVICNENELIERFGIQCCPVTLDDLVTEMERVMAAREPAFRETVEYIRSISAAGSKEGIEKTAGLKLAMRSLAEARGCRAVAIQCWDSLQHLTGVMPCLSNALLSDEGLPVVCETDIHGAITAVMTQALTFNTEPQFFADLTVRHPKDDNAELLWHCGNFPRSLAGDQASATAGLNRYNADRYGVAQWELKSADHRAVRRRSRGLPPAHRGGGHHRGAAEPGQLCLDEGEKLAAVGAPAGGRALHSPCVRGVRALRRHSSRGLPIYPRPDGRRGGARRRRTAPSLDGLAAPVV